MGLHVHPHKFKKGKNFIEYLLEFLMIFIAVSGSFLAENVRENYVEKHREKELLKSMLVDLKNDTSSLRGIIKYCNDQTKGLDSLLDVLEDTANIDNQRKASYYDNNYIGTVNLFIPNDRIISNLKNSGGFRLIKDSLISDGIISYYNIKSLESNENIYLKRTFDVVESQYEFTNFIILRKCNNSDSTFSIHNFPIYLKYDSNTVKGYYRAIYYLQNIIQNYVLYDLKGKQEEAEDLIKIIKEKYHFD